jgi:hypothetical protein
VEMKEGDALSLGDLFASAPDVTLGGVTRSPGVHVSDLITAHIERLYPNLYDKPDLPPEASENWQRMGFLWEDLLTQFFAAKIRQSQAIEVVRAGEIVFDGVYLTPDWYTYDAQGMILGESKLTWKSRRGFDLYAPKFLHWLYQMRAYCRALETTRARLYVIWINGDYTRFVPEVRPYDITFTVQELGENWTMLKNTGRKVGLL